MTAESPAEAHPEAVVRKRKGMQTVWIIPIVAALVGGWLWYRALQEQGPTITISFATAEGLEAGKTKIKYKDLEVGQVSTITLDPSLEFVVVTAEMAPGAKDYMVEKTSFWVVKPRIGAGGISGLSTIVSGAYIAMDIAKTGTPTKAFKGLEEPPPRPANAKGLRVKLRSDSLASISQGTVVSHLQIKMGSVDSYTYLQDEELIEFVLYIEPEYASLVRKNTRFWNSSGVDVHLSAEGFDIHTESLEALLTGGIAFGAAPHEPSGPPAESGDVFTLMKSKAAAQEINSEPRRTILYFHEPIGGLSIGSTVEFQGIVIGKVLEVDVEFDAQTAKFRMPVIVETYTNRLVTTGQDEDEPFDVRLKRMAERGMRAQLGTANLLTGARGIQVVFNKEAPAAYYAGDSGLPELPTIPSTGEALKDMIAQLPTIVADLKSTVNGVSDIVHSENTRETLESVQQASAALEAVLEELRTDSGPMMASVQTTVDDLRTLIDGVNTVVADIGADTPDLLATIQAAATSAQKLLESGDKGMATLASGMPVVQQELVMALREVAAGMSSLADLADYLERHPESLLSGKDNSGGQ